MAGGNILLCWFFDNSSLPTKERLAMFTATFHSPLLHTTAFWWWIDFWKNMTVPYHFRESSLHLTARRRNEFCCLMRSAKPTSQPGEFVGKQLILRRTRRWAAVAGDTNPVHLTTPHPKFGTLIAHGWDALTMAMAALKLDLPSGLIPKKVTAEFRKPMSLREHSTPMIRILVPPEKPLERLIEVYVGMTLDLQPKLVIKVMVELAKGTLSDEDWLHAIIGGWRISALLASTFPHCLYYQQILVFTPTSQEFTHIVTRVRGQGLNGSGHCVVDTRAQGRTSPNGHWSFATGQATIVLPQ